MTDSLPEGLLYRPGFVTDEEERGLVAAFADFSFSEVVMHGRAAKRTVAHFGYRYEYASWRLTPAEPLPEALTWFRDRAAGLADVEPEAFGEALVTLYPPGAGIGWHRDAPRFGPVVVGVSLGSGCVMRFQRRTSTARQVHSLELAPRSAYVLRGPARTSWQHSIPRTYGLRYSVTFRTLATASAAR